MHFDPATLVWLNPPRQSHVTADEIRIVTEAHTDFWQRTYYGFRNDNGHALLTKVRDPFFSFIVKTSFDSKRRFDQCGVIVYQNSDNWLKASIEYENERFQRLGSVVTNNGHSDWASTDIPASQRSMHYRLSRRQSDFCVECSEDGVHFRQMRIAHLAEGAGEIQVGIYACSPEASSFTATFTDIRFTECAWLEHR